MQVSIWNEYIKKLNNRMRRQNRNILLLVDNALTHALYETTYLTNITIKYLPPNITSHLQPCDQGIINSFKSQYRKLYLRNRVKAFDKFREFGIEPVEIDIQRLKELEKVQVLIDKLSFEDPLDADEFV